MRTVVLAADFLLAAVMAVGQPAEWSSIKHKVLNVAYGSESKAQTFDVYWPESGRGPWPVIVSIHGGAFAFGDKRDVELFSTLRGLERGYAVVSVNYRLIGEAIFPAAIGDVRAAVAYARRHASKWNLDPDRFAAWGASAGGHLAALAGTMGEGDTKLQAVVDEYGPVDFLAMDGQFQRSGIKGQVHNAPDSPESRYLGAPIPSVPDKVKAANPLTYLDAGDPPFYIQHGSSDPLIPVAQSVEFAAALAKVLGKDKVVLRIIEGARHGGPGFASQESLDLIFDWLARVLKK